MLAITMTVKVSLSITYNTTAVTLMRIMSLINNKNNDDDDDDNNN